MYDAATRLFPDSTAAIMCAAVADFTPADVADEKIRREGSQMVLHLNPTRDIAAAVGQMKRNSQKLCGFALETHNAMEHAKEKLTHKNLDMIVMNSLQDKGAGFRVDTNKVTLITAEGSTPLPLMSKQEVADNIIAKLFA